MAVEIRELVAFEGDFRDQFVMVCNTTGSVLPVILEASRETVETFVDRTDVRSFETAYDLTEAWRAFTDRAYKCHKCGEGDIHEGGLENCKSCNELFCRAHHEDDVWTDNHNGIEKVYGHTC